MAALSLRKKKLSALAVLTGRRFWVKKIFQERKIHGLCHILTNELRLFDKEYFFRFVRMTPQRSEHLLLSLVGSHLQRTTTRMREPTSAADSMILTLRFLASSDLQQLLCFSFRIGRAAICTILGETCEKLWEVLSSFYVRACFSFRINRAAIYTILSKTREKFWEVISLFYVRAPNTVLEWKKFSKEFFDIWDMPHCSCDRCYRW